MTLKQIRASLLKAEAVLSRIPKVLPHSSSVSWSFSRVCRRLSAKALM